MIEDYHYDECGLLHRLDGPAAVRPDGWNQWFVHGVRHREDGPASEHKNGAKDWRVNGKRHRLDGPAVIRKDGSKEWWVDGQKVKAQNFPIAVIKFLLKCDKLFAKLLFETLKDI